MSGRHLEDFVAGDVIASGEEYEITSQRIRDFATEYDPQPIHLDPAAAEASMFGGIIASGWHSLSVTMRLIVRSNIFGGAPVVNVLVSMATHPPKTAPSPMLYVGFLLVCAGAGLVLYYKPSS